MHVQTPSKLICSFASYNCTVSQHSCSMLHMSGALSANLHFSMLNMPGAPSVNLQVAHNGLLLSTLSVL